MLKSFCRDLPIPEEKDLLNLNLASKREITINIRPLDDLRDTQDKLGLGFDEDDPLRPTGIDEVYVLYILYSIYLYFFLCSQDIMEGANYEMGLPGEEEIEPGFAPMDIDWTEPLPT
jgi:hypothetical protein